MKAAQASAFDLEGGAGARFGLVFDDTTGLGLAIRTDLLVTYQLLSHFSEDDPEPARRGRWLPGLDLMLEGSWALSHSTALVFAAGGALVAGRTGVYTHGEEVAVLPIGRVLFEIGVRAGF